MEMCNIQSFYIIPYSGYNLRGAISAKHQIPHLEVIFAVIKFANHSMVLPIYAPSAYRYFDYKHRLYAVIHVMESEVDSFTVESVIRGCVPHLRGV